MKTFDPDYKLLDEMYQDDYYPVFLVDKCSYQEDLRKKPWKVCCRRLPVKTEIPSAKLKRAAFWVNISSSISSMFRRRSSLAGFLTGLSSWNMTMMTYSMRRFVKLRCC